MSSVEQQAIQTYQNNINYFSQSHPDLYKKIQTLEAAIDTGQFVEKYELEHIDGYFDVKDKTTQTYLYGKDSLTLAKHVAKQVNFKKDDQIFETLINFTFDDNAIQYIDTLTLNNPYQSNPLKGTAEIIHYINSNSTKQDLMKDVYKYIFLGVGLGLHLSEIDKKTNAYIYLIVEDDIELFRLSLFVTDYEKISHNSTLHFSISESGSIFRDSLNNFFTTAYIRNNYLKYFLFTNAYDHKIKEIQAFIVSQSFRVYTYDRLIQKSLTCLYNLKENYNFLDISASHNDTIFSKRPVLYLTPGPSLSKNIQWVKENHKRFIIVTVFAALKVLEKNFIVPNIIVHVDESITGMEKIKKQISSIDFIKDSAFVFAASAPKELLNLFNKDSIYLIQDLTRYKNDFGGLEGHSVGEVGYALMLLFGTHDLYLLGLDLALDSETGSTHSADHHATQNLDMSNIDAAEEVATLTKTTIKIKGNFQNSVPTTALLYMSIPLVNAFTTRLKKPYQNVYNLSNGAFFDYIEPKEVENIDVQNIQLIDHVKVQTEIMNFLNSHASNHLSQLDSDGIKYRIDEANTIKDAIHLHSKQNFPNFDIYNKAFVNLLSNLVLPATESRKELSHIFLFYTQNIAGYITDFFNTKGLGNTKRHIKKIDKILVSQLLNIVNVYLDMLIKVNER